MVRSRMARFWYPVDQIEGKFRSTIIVAVCCWRPDTPQNAGESRDQRVNSNQTDINMESFEGPSSLVMPSTTRETLPCFGTGPPTNRLVALVRPHRAGSVFNSALNVWKTAWRRPT